MDTMTCADDEHRLHRDGLSVRAIAKRLGLSRMKVHRVLMAAGSAVGVTTDHGEDTEYLLDDDAERVVVPPLTFVGDDRRIRWVDAERVSVTSWIPTLWA